MASQNMVVLEKLETFRVPYKRLGAKQYLRSVKGIYLAWAIKQKQAVAKTLDFLEAPESAC